MYLYFTDIKLEIREVKQLIQCHTAPMEELDECHYAT